MVVKGDLSLDGAPEEWEAFERCYRDPFGDRLHVVRGNHDGYRFQTEYAGDQQIDLAGVTIALLDTVIPGMTTGDVTQEQADWLDALAADATQPVLVMGHHQQWIAGPGADPGEAKRSDDYFGLHPDGSDRLDEVCARRPAIVAYTCGHTHRHRVRTMTASRVPSIEIGCTKDFPGTWAEYRVHDDAIMQVVHRMSSPAALAWSESCRGLYAEFDIDYETYALGTLADRCLVIPTVALNVTACALRNSDREQADGAGSEHQPDDLTTSDAFLGDEPSEHDRHRRVHRGEHGTDAEQAGPGRQHEEHGRDGVEHAGEHHGTPRPLLGEDGARRHEREAGEHQHRDQASADERPVSGLL